MYVNLIMQICYSEWNKDLDQFFSSACSYKLHTQFYIEVNQLHGACQIKKEQIIHIKFFLQAVKSWA